MSVAHTTSPTRHRVGASHEISERGRLIVDIGERTIGVFRFKNVLYAYENLCAHTGGPVCQGRLVPGVREELDDAKRSVGAAFDEDDLRIVCPWHGAEYSLRTGAHPTQPQFTLRSYPVGEEGGSVYVTV